MGIESLDRKMTLQVNRPDVVETWSDKQVALRWLQVLFSVFCPAVTSRAVSS
jgi:hypothetical protein